jgi:preprotein translocase subunit YajC
MPGDFLATDQALLMDSLLDLFIGTAAAQGTTPAPASPLGGLGGLLLPVMLIVVFYFLLIRPQQKKQKEHSAMVSALSVGTEIVTDGGVLGKITELGEQFVTVEIADGVSIKLQRHAIKTVLPKDTIKHA